MVETVAALKATAAAKTVATVKTTVVAEVVKKKKAVAAALRTTAAPMAETVQAAVTAVEAETPAVAA